MKLLFNYIKARIEDKMPEIKTIRVWNNQFMYSRGEKYFYGSEQNERFRTEKAFRYPACFVEFETLKTVNYSLGIKDITMIVRFHLGLEGYKHERLDTLDFIDKFTEVMQLTAPTAESGLIFTTFQKIKNELDYDHDNIQEPIVEYQTTFRSTAGYWYKNMKQVAVTGEVTDNNDIIVNEL